MQVGLLAIEPDEYVIRPAVVRDGMEGPVEVRHEVNNPPEGLLA